MLRSPGVTSASSRASSDSRLAGERRRQAVQRLRLAPQRFDQPRVPVAEVQVHHLRGEVQVPLAVGVPEAAALAAGDAQRLDPALGAPGVDDVLVVHEADAIPSRRPLHRGRRPPSACAHRRPAGAARSGHHRRKGRSRAGPRQHASHTEDDMDIGIIGSGRVAQTLATKLLELGHRVTDQLARHGEGQGPRATGAPSPRRRRSRPASGSSAARRRREASPTPPPHGEVVINATAGGHSVEALEAAGADNLAGKILVDVANPLDFSKGMPPTLLFCNTESLGERIQAAFPDARVVKSLNTTNAQVMVDPAPAHRATPMFVSATTRRPRTGSTANCSSAGSAGSRCWTSATSPPRAGWRCSCPCG